MKATVIGKIRCMFILLLPVIMPIGCSTIGHPSIGAIVVNGGLPEKWSNIFKLHVQSISIFHTPMSKALDDIRKAISEQTTIEFDYSIEYNKPGISKEHLELRDRDVSIQASNLSLGEVIDSLCKQSGWSYDWDAAGAVLYFSDDNRYHFTLDNTPHGWLGWHFKENEKKP